MEALNALEIDAHYFGEESNLVTKQCSDVMSEIDALLRVKLASIPLNINVDLGRGATTRTAGRYPTIKNLRLAYRVNPKAGVGRKEICAAWNQAAHLITFTCGLNPSFCSSNIRIIPLSCLVEFLSILREKWPDSTRFGLWPYQRAGRAQWTIRPLRLISEQAFFKVFIGECGFS